MTIGICRGYVLDTINQLLQDGSNGQSLKLSLQAIQGAYLNQRYPTANKLIVYLTGNTKYARYYFEYIVHFCCRFRNIG